MENQITYAIAGLLAGVGIGYGIARAVDAYRDKKYDDIFEEDFEADEEILEFIEEEINPSKKNYANIPAKPDINDILKKHENEDEATDEEERGVKVIGAADYEAKNGFEKLTATYFVKDKILAGYDNELEEQNGTERGEFIVDHILASTNKNEFYFRDLDDTSDIYVLVSEESFDDAYAEFLESEVAEHIEASKEG